MYLILSGTWLPHDLLTCIHSPVNISPSLSYHLTEIMATVINEYTDWERPVRHPISTREETLALLSDALYGAPVMHTGNLHSLASSMTYLYVFDYQTRNGDFEQVSKVVTS